MKPSQEPANLILYNFFDREEQTGMEQDELIFLGAAVLLGQMASHRPPDPDEIKTAVQTARNLRDEVEQQHEDARARKEPKKV
jgi:hypothetical protein